MLWYSLEVPLPDVSNEYPKHMLLWRNKKNIRILVGNDALSELHKLNTCTKTPDRVNFYQNLVVYVFSYIFTTTSSEL